MCGISAFTVSPHQHLSGCEPRQARRPRRETPHVPPPVGPQYATRCRIQHRENATRRRTSQRLAAIGTRAPAIFLALAGQIAPEGQARAAVQQRDSQHVLRSAREAQAEFESVRRHNLPTQFGAGGTDCDERIGRFCFWYDDGAASPGSPPPEPERIGRARDRLVARLDTAAAAVPGDDWIAGQRVRYLLQSGRSADALAAAQACRAAPWWCEALAGLAQHVAELRRCGLRVSDRLAGHAARRTVSLDRRVATARRRAGPALPAAPLRRARRVR